MRLLVARALHLGYRCFCHHLDKELLIDCGVLLSQLLKLPYQVEVLVLSFQKSYEQLELVAMYDSIVAVVYEPKKLATLLLRVSINGEHIDSSFLQPLGLRKVELIFVNPSVLLPLNQYLMRPSPRPLG